MEKYSPILWTLVTTLIALIELGVLGTFFLIPFIAGGIAATITAFLTTGLLAPLSVFLLISTIAAFFLVPISQKINRLDDHQEKSGIYRLIGLDGLVTKSTTHHSGQVKIQSEIWMANTESDTNILEGETVTVLRIEGTRLIVEKRDTKERITQ